MPKGKNQKLKLSVLSRILLEKTDEDHYLTLSEIIDELARNDISAERKSLYDDFDVMRESLDIDIEMVKKGRECLYHVVDREFELAEIKLMIDAIQASKFITQKKSDALISKLKKYVSKYQAEQLKRQVYINDRNKNVNEKIYYTVDAIHTAIRDNRQIKFKYCSWDISKKLVPRNEGAFYQISPWALTWADENYYMVAYDSKAEMIKHYRVDKMIDTSVTDERRDGKDLFKNFDLSSYAVANFGMFGGDLKRVHIEFPNDKVGIFIDRFGKNADIRKVTEERSEVVVDIAISRQFFGWIFSLGEDIKITRPAQVREDMLNSAKSLVVNYEQ